MSKTRIIMQGDVYICNLQDGKDSEQCGLRPCVVLQLDILNQASNNVIIVPITKQRKKWLPTHVLLSREKYDFFNYNTNTVLCENIRCISKTRLEKYVGKIDNEDLERILDAKEYSFRLIDDNNNEKGDI